MPKPTCVPPHVVAFCRQFSAALKRRDWGMIDPYVFTQIGADEMPLSDLEEDEQNMIEVLAEVLRPGRSLNRANS